MLGQITEMEYFFQITHFSGPSQQTTGEIDRPRSGNLLGHSEPLCLLSYDLHMQPPHQRRSRPGSNRQTSAFARRYSLPIELQEQKPGPLPESNRLPSAISPFLRRPVHNRGQGRPGAIRTPTIAVWSRALVQLRFRPIDSTPPSIRTKIQTRGQSPARFPFRQGRSLVSRIGIGPMTSRFSVAHSTG